VHVHGSYWFYECCNLTTEIAGRAEVARDSSSTMSFLLDSILRTHSPIVLGYSGWENDVIMSALRRRLESMLPHNAYWFCYRAEEAERLPAWLKEHRNMFMVKEAADKELSAKAVLDAMNRAFDLESPLLTANPLEFFAKHLRDSLLDSTDDVYAIRSVIERLERARDTENIVGGTVESQMERVRDAIRRSDYDSALQAALHLDLSAMAAEALEELRQHIVERMPWTSNVQAFELVNRIDKQLVKMNAIPETQGPGRLAFNLVNRARALESSDRVASLAVYDEILTHFSHSSAPQLRRATAIAHLGRARLLTDLHRAGEAMHHLDKLVAAFGDDNYLAEIVAGAVILKADCLELLGDVPGSLASLDEAVARFEGSRDPAAKSIVTRALLAKAQRRGAQT